jgi:hypothetical protein
MSEKISIYNFTEYTKLIFENKSIKLILLYILYRKFLYYIIFI